MALTKISQAGAKDEAINEAKIQISNAGTNGQYLQKQSGNTGGLTWADVSTADATKMPLAGGTFTGDVIWDNQTNAGNDLTWDESEDQLEFKDGVKATFGDGGDLVIGHDFVNHVDKSLIYSTTDLDIGCNKVSFMDQLRNTRLTVDHNNAVIDIVDNAKLRLGTGNDLQIYHDGSNSWLTNATGSLFIKSDTAIKFQDAGGNEDFLVINDNGAVDLYYDNAKKLETKSNGVMISSATNECELAIKSTNQDGAPSILFVSDNADDNADNWRIRADGSGTALTISNYADASWETSIECNESGNVELYYDNSKKFETISSGVSVTGALAIPDGASDGNRIAIGNHDDLLLYHDGTYNWIDSVNNHDLVLKAGTGDVYIQGSDIFIGDEGANEKYIDAHKDGAVELYYDNSKKLETTSAGSKIQGNLVLENTSQSKILSHTADGSDDNWLSINGGGDASQTRGGGVTCFGNEATDNQGKINIAGGNSGSANGTIDFSTGGSLRARLTHDGHFTLSNDSSKLKLGASNDLQIYHDGSNSVIQHGTTGNMRYHAGNHDFYNQAGDEYQLRMLQDGAVTLYYNGNQKVQTTSTGVTVSSSGSAELTVKAANNSDAILNLNCDNEDNDGDHWRFVSQQANNKLAIQHKGSGSYADKFDIDSSGNISIGGGLTSSTTAKAWIVMNMSTGSSLDSFGVSSISDEGTGTFDINFSTALSNNNAAAFASVSDSALHAQIVDGDSDGNGFRYRCLDGGGSLTDDIHTSFIIFDN